MSAILNPNNMVEAQGLNVSIQASSNQADIQFEPISN